MPENETRQGPAAEASDIHPRRVLAVAGILLLTLILAAAAIWGLLRLWGAPIAAGPNLPPNFEPAGPGLESAPQTDRAAYFAEKEKQLHSYGWVDRRAGIAHIPIEAAMVLLAAGKPARKGGRR